HFTVSLLLSYLQCKQTICCCNKKCYISSFLLQFFIFYINNKRNKTKFKLPYKMCHFFQNKKQILLIVSALHIEIYLIENFIRQQMLLSFIISFFASRILVAL